MSIYINRLPPTNSFSISVMGSLAFYSAVIVILLTISPYNFQSENLGAFKWSVNSRDALENLALMLPLGVFLSLCRKKYKPIYLFINLCLGLLLSVSIEIAQLFLEQRTSQYWDIICNTISLFIGSFIGIIIKPTVERTFKKTPTSILLMLYTLSLLSILIFTQVITSGRDIGLFEIMLLFSSHCLIALIFSEYAYKSGKSLTFQSNIASVIYVFITCSALLSNNVITLLLISLLFSLLAPLMILFLTAITNISYKAKKIFLLLLASAPLAIYFFVTLFNVNNTNLDLPSLLQENRFHISNYRALAGGVVEVILLYITFGLVINCILINNKTSSFKPYIYGVILIIITAIYFQKIINCALYPALTCSYLIFLLLTPSLYCTQNLNLKNRMLIKIKME